MSNITDTSIECGRVKVESVHVYLIPRIPPALPDPSKELLAWIRNGCLEEIIVHTSVYHLNKDGKLKYMGPSRFMLDRIEALNPTNKRIKDDVIRRLRELGHEPKPIYIHRDEYNSQNQFI